MVFFVHLPISDSPICARHFCGEVWPHNRRLLQKGKLRNSLYALHLTWTQSNKFDHWLPKGQAHYFFVFLRFLCHTVAFQYCSLFIQIQKLKYWLKYSCFGIKMPFSNPSESFFLCDLTYKCFWWWRRCYIFPVPSCLRELQAVYVWEWLGLWLNYTHTDAKQSYTADRKKRLLRLNLCKIWQCGTFSQDCLCALQHNRCETIRKWLISLKHCFVCATPHPLLFTL